MQTRFEFSRSSGEVEARATYVYATARGVLASPDEVRKFYTVIREVMAKLGVRRVLIDARGQTEEPSQEVRAAAWERLEHLAPERVAYVIAESQAMKATRVNMTGLSSTVRIRAFHSVVDAHRWLSRPSK